MSSPVHPIGNGSVRLQLVVFPELIVLSPRLLSNVLINVHAPRALNTLGLRVNKPPHAKRVSPRSIDSVGVVAGITATTSIWAASMKQLTFGFASRSASRIADGNHGRDRQAELRHRLRRLRRSSRARVLSPPSDLAIPPDRPPLPSRVTVAVLSGRSWATLSLLGRVSARCFNGGVRHRGTAAFVLVAGRREPGRSGVRGKRSLTYALTALSVQLATDVPRSPA